MFRLEKVFQNDDLAFNFFCNFIKSIILIFLSYIFIIIIDNSIFELAQYSIFINSNYFIYSIILSIIFFINSFFFIEGKRFVSNFIFFLRSDILNLFVSNIFTFTVLLTLSIEFVLEKRFIYLLILQSIILFLIKLYFNNLYKYLINKNIIQKNILLIGTYEEIKKILYEKLDKIFICKCCIVTDLEKFNSKIIKSEIKFPIFTQEDDLRSILEYHSLGQIWILNGNKGKNKILSKVFRFSVDTLNIKLEKVTKLKQKNLIADKYDFDFYEMSKFYGINLFMKILIDKILAIFFLTLAIPLIIISMLAVYIEDGYPVIFTQNRTGWDGRRFRIYKIRTLINKKYDPIKQVSSNDDRKLKIGKFIRRFSIDELPQLINVLKGEMSIVGPRPHPVSLDLNYSNYFKLFLTRYRCNPGLTGWAQIHGLRGATPEPKIMKKRMIYDLWYLKNWTIWLDFYIILRTFYVVLKHQGD